MELIRLGFGGFQVTLVVNYDLPVKNTQNRNAYAEPDYETYLHRIGRSGRFGRKGKYFRTPLGKLCRFKCALSLRYCSIGVPLGCVVKTE